MTQRRCAHCGRLSGLQLQHRAEFLRLYDRAARFCSLRCAALYGIAALERHEPEAGNEARPARPAR